MARTAKFDTTRTYGVEIEGVGLSPREAARVIQAAGIECEYEGYNHTTSPHWKVVTDSSLRYEYGQTFEVVSPPMAGQEGLREIRAVCEALENAGAKINRSCGLHVHHDINDLDRKQITRILAIYKRFQPAIDRLLAPSRRIEAGNRYCQGLHTLWTWTRLQTTTNPAEDHWDRYTVVNLECYMRQGTVEFRQHQGTINGDKIVAWVLLTQAIVLHAKEVNSRIAPFVSNAVNETPYTLCGGVAGMMKYLGMTGDDNMQWAKDFYYKRKKHFDRLARQVA